MPISDLCTSFIKKKEISDSSTDRNIVEFVTSPWGLGLGSVPGVPGLYPAQMLILKCYYGLELDSSSNRNIIVNDQFNENELYRFNESEYIRYLYNEGRTNVPEITKPFPNIIMVIGRRGGKTVLTSCIIAFETYKLLNKYSPQEYYGIMPEDDIRLTCISTSKETASELFGKVTAHFERSEFFRRYRLSSTKQSMYLQTQRDIEKYGRGNRASVSTHVAPCSAKGLRGHNNIVIGLDEMAHFFEDERSSGEVSTSDKNDKAIYNAVTPSIARFRNREGVNEGKIICISSPSVKSGKFFEEYERSFKPETNDLLMIQAPSWEIDPELSPAFLRQEYAKNSLVYNVEYGAQFDDRLKGWLEDPQVVRQCIVPGLRYKERSSERVPHFMGVDVGLKNDGTSICVCHHVHEIIGGERQTLIEVDTSDIRFAEDENKPHFTPQEIADWMIDYTKRFYIVKGLMDQYYGMGIIPILEQEGLRQFEYRIFTEQLNSMIYQNLLTQFISNNLRLPEGQKQRVDNKVETDSELVQELLTLQAYQKSKYLIRVAAPDREGCHDDRSDAFARAVLLATEYKNKGFGNKIPVASMAQSKRLVFNKTRELAKINLNRPSNGVTTARQLFQRSIYRHMGYR